jgi:hypothetical protein
MRPRGPSVPPSSRHFVLAPCLFPAPRMDTHPPFQLPQTPRTTLRLSILQLMSYGKGTGDSYLSNITLSFMEDTGQYLRVPGVDVGGSLVLDLTEVRCGSVVLLWYLLLQCVAFSTLNCLHYF